jgi:MFS family permease
MARRSNATGIGRRLDSLAISRFHVRLIALIAAGMFFDSFDIYLAAGVLGAMVRSGESTLSLNATFISFTFGGMMVGARMAGVLGDRYGRRFCYQFNLALWAANGASSCSPSSASSLALPSPAARRTGCIYVLSSLSIATYLPGAVPDRVADSWRRAAQCDRARREHGYSLRGGLGVRSLWHRRRRNADRRTLLAQAVIVALFGPETRRRSLEDLGTYA